MVCSLCPVQVVIELGKALIAMAMARALVSELFIY